MLIVVERAPAAADALRELVELMRAAAPGGMPRRDAATRYMQCRQALLQSRHRSMLPGFLMQCGSIFKFSEFITLYDPGVAARLAFVDAAFLACRRSLDTGPMHDVFDDLDF